MSQAIEQFEEILRQKAAQFIQMEAGPNSLITVTRVISDDKRRSVKIFFTTLPEDKEDTALIFINRKKRDFKDFLKENTRMRAIPYISFEIDYGERNRQNVDSLLGSE